MTPLTTDAFDLPAHLTHKSAPALVAADEVHFAAIARSLEHTITELSDRLDTVRRAPAGHGQTALERDQEVHRLTARLRALRRYGLDLTLGRMVAQDHSEPVYVGRFGLTDEDGRRLLVDWRSPAAEPFFGATHNNPMGLANRRRYRWTRGRVRDYWDEVFVEDGIDHHAALDDQSAFIASLGANRSARMRDVLGTIQADQDVIIRAGSRGPLVVDGGPGTGKTVVALHRTAYLLYSDPRLGHRRGGVLFVGPHQPYLAYVSDVLPSLGEEGVQTCTLRDLVPEGATAPDETDAEVARLKASVDLVRAIDPAVRLYEEPPTERIEVSTPWDDVWVGADDWAAAFDAPSPGTPHNEARDVVWDELVTIVVDRHDDEEATPEMIRAARRARPRPARGARPRVADARGDGPRRRPLVGAGVPATVRAVADDRRGPRAPAGRPGCLDGVRPAPARRGPAAARRPRGVRAEAAPRRGGGCRAEEMSKVVEHLIATDDSEMHLMSMLRGEDLQGALDDRDEAGPDPDLLAGPFAHVVVDEAQELTDAEWQMLLARCPSRSLTIVGDRAQARHGFTESWEERLARVGLDRVTMRSLSINYRTPEEVMALAEPVIRAALPDANVPTSIRRSGVPVGARVPRGPRTVVERWLAAHEEGSRASSAIRGSTHAPESSRSRPSCPRASSSTSWCSSTRTRSAPGSRVRSIATSR